MTEFEMITYFSAGCFILYGLEYSINGIDDIETVSGIILVIMGITLLLL